MDSARSLARVTQDVIATLDDSGQVEDTLVLGLDPVDVERLWLAPEGEKFFEYLNALPDPVSVGLL